ncbi:armadillo-type protein [Dioszegia hungarica]|uniref:Eukaryotic translation initiation factor 3 subunit K n=1 Tax=Dioszegia hungarica TaxID=4972 RepID=A0AA38LQS5_9TREE|nr:armadillo-type protein [Dioszegia hungarica]KAI9631948.1 armadillo-type protein [Dioszegia hungarica]
MSESTSAAPVKSLNEWHSPSSRTEVIHELIHGVDRYNPTNLSYMEEYLQAQVQSGEYDLLAYLAVLKLYQFNPHMSNPDIITHILLKALSHTVHGPDFTLCLHLLREPAAILSDIDSDDQSLVVVLPFLQKLHQLSRTCQFTQFWSELNGESEGASTLRDVYLPQNPHFTSTTQLNFARSISSSFSRIKTAQLARWLDLSEGEVKQWAEKAGWKVDGEMVAIPGNGDNDVKAGVVNEQVELSQLTKLIAAAAY